MLEHDIDYYFCSSQGHQTNVGTGSLATSERVILGKCDSSGCYNYPITIKPFPLESNINLQIVMLPNCFKIEIVSLVFPCFTE